MTTARFHMLGRLMTADRRIEADRNSSGTGDRGGQEVRIRGAVLRRAKDA